MSTDLKSHIDQIEDFDCIDWAGIQRKILVPVNEVRQVARDLGEGPANKRLVLALNEVEDQLYRLGTVSTAITLDLTEISAGLDGLVRMLARLDDFKISAAELCGLTKPLALMLSNVLCHHHELNC